MEGTLLSSIMEEDFLFRAVGGVSVRRCSLTTAPPFMISAHFWCSSLSTGERGKVSPSSFARQTTGSPPSPVEVSRLASCWKLASYHVCQPRELVSAEHHRQRQLVCPTCPLPHGAPSFPKEPHTN